MKTASVLGLTLVCVAAVLGSARVSRSGSKVILGRTWPPSAGVPLARIDHRAWDALLRKYVDDAGYVNYRAWKADPADLRRLDQYLATLSQGVPDHPDDRAANLAFWINAYNAVTMEGILREYPTTSIRNHTPRLFGYNIWNDLLLVVGGRKVSLNQIEHEILRRMGEPRIHFAIVCASVGCPKLRNETYLAATIDDQLTANARDFFADPAKFSYDVQTRQIRVSPILKWFGSDFGATVPEQMAAIAPYVLKPAARQLAASGSARVSYLDYDWGLNDQARKR